MTRLSTMRSAALGFILIGGCFEESDPVGNGNSTTASSDGGGGSTAMTSAATSSGGTGDDDDDDDDDDTTSDGPGTTGVDSTGEPPTDGATTDEPPDSPLVVYGSPPVTGNLAAEAGGASLAAYTQERCSEPPPFAQEGCTQARAVISLPGFDLDMLGVPTGRPIVTPMGQPVAEGIIMFLAGAFQTVPADAGVLTRASEFWTGAGGPQADDCEGWTSSTASGTVGRTDASGPKWLDQGPIPCDQLRPLLCLCWSD